MESLRAASVDYFLFQFLAPVCDILESLVCDILALSAHWGNKIIKLETQKYIDAELKSRQLNI